jgi:protein-L-isoaspartate(D-aspartate) O-methyltransferase
MMSRPRTTTLALAAALALIALAQTPDEARWRQLREKMVRETIAQPADGRDPVRDRRVLEALRAVPRHEFVPEDQRAHAYADHPLPIGHGQTISQPYIVAKMTELLALRPEHRVLEVGAGSGYQAAVLSPLVKEVYTIEIVQPLGVAAQERLAHLGYQNVEVRVGDGYFGWPDKGPFDAIIVTAWASHVPPPLVEQLKPGGRMVIPVGTFFYNQNLVVVHKGSKGPKDLRIESVMPVVFVPLTGAAQKKR